MTAVQHRNRQDIEDGEIDAEQSDEKDQIGRPLLGLLPRHLGDHDGAAQRVGRQAAGDELGDADHRQFGDPPGLHHALPQRLKGVEPPVEDLPPGGDPHHEPLGLFAEHVRHGGALRGDLDMKLASVPGHGDSQGLAAALPDDLGHRIPGSHRPFVDGDDFVPRLNSGPIRRGVRLHGSHHRFQLGHARNLENHEENQRRQQHVEGRPGGDDQNPLEHRLVVEGHRDVFGGQVRVGLFAHHLDESAQGDAGDSVIGAAHGLARQPGTESQGKNFHPDPAEPGHDKMAELVDEHEHAQNNDKRQNAVHSNAFIAVSPTPPPSPGPIGRPREWRRDRARTPARAGP